MVDYENLRKLHTRACPDKPPDLAYDLSKRNADEQIVIATRHITASKWLPWTPVHVICGKKKAELCGGLGVDTNETCVLCSCAECGTRASKLKEYKEIGRQWGRLMTLEAFYEHAMGEEIVSTGNDEEDEDVAKKLCRHFIKVKVRKDSSETNMSYGDWIKCQFSKFVAKPNQKGKLIGRTVHLFWYAQSSDNGKFGRWYDGSVSGVNASEGTIQVKYAPSTLTDNRGEKTMENVAIGISYMHWGKSKPSSTPSTGWRPDPFPFHNLGESAVTSVQHEVTNAAGSGVSAYADAPNSIGRGGPLLKAVEVASLAAAAADDDDDDDDDDEPGNEPPSTPPKRRVVTDLSIPSTEDLLEGRQAAAGQQVPGPSSPISLLSPGGADTRQAVAALQALSSAGGTDSGTGRSKLATKRAAIKQNATDDDDEVFILERTSTRSTVQLPPTNTKKQRKGGSSSINRPQAGEEAVKAEVGIMEAKPSSKIVLSSSVVAEEAGDAGLTASPSPAVPVAAAGSTPIINGGTSTAAMKRSELTFTAAGSPTAAKQLQQVASSPADISTGAAVQSLNLSQSIRMSLQKIQEQQPMIRASLGRPSAMKDTYNNPSLSNPGCEPTSVEAATEAAAAAGQAAGKAGHQGRQIIDQGHLPGNKHPPSTTTCTLLSNNTPQVSAGTTTTTATATTGNNTTATTATTTTGINTSALPTTTDAGSPDLVLSFLQHAHRNHPELIAGLAAVFTSHSHLERLGALVKEMQQQQPFQTAPDAAAAVDGTAAATGTRYNIADMARISSAPRSSAAAATTGHYASPVAPERSRLLSIEGVEESRREARLKLLVTGLRPRMTEDAWNGLEEVFFDWPEEVRLPSFRVRLVTMARVMAFLGVPESCMMAAMRKLQGSSQGVFVTMSLLQQSVECRDLWWCVRLVDELCGGDGPMWYQSNRTMQQSEPIHENGGEPNSKDKRATARAIRVPRCVTEYITQCSSDQVT
ncbi:hypothetical protein CEUSTIGMA_g1829.t1 [Chlamydomonas eustigma]|uniref:Uncharacterized protein n=1 Tax=Chlamydomonas eustigma TaxID=1157962 RepID=A0A250WU79_9CHLO|nr:hypothetical protein CEUSTIGMA_g1829.t1 [Chlamydomonas eustigma]|eukprot:GAX74381.1 hypothetical protein CEUSTIGMA_g1829.t1 [Chlamydomonas eustigma]